VVSNGSNPDIEMFGDYESVLAQFPDNAVQLAFGHRRLEAFKELGRENIPVDLRTLSNQQMADLAWAENERRQDVSPIERAMAIQARIDEFQWTHEDAAEQLRMSRPAVSNLLRLLKLPEEIKEHVHEGELSVRAADALLSITELPENLLEAAEEDYWEEYQPGKIMEKVKAGELTSDEIRERSQGIVQRNTEDLENAIFPLDHAFDGDLIVSPTCNACESKVKGMCAVGTCWDAKENTWKLLLVSKASEESGIPALELGEDETAAIARTTFWEDDITLGEEGIFNQGCPHGNLRLEYDNHPNVADALDIENHPRVSIVCHHGTGKSCTCAKARKEKVNEGEKGEQKERKKILNDEIVAPAAAALAEAIFEGETSAWLILFRKVAQTGGSEKWSLETLQNRIAVALVKKELPYWSPEDHFDTSRDKVEKNILKPIGREDAITFVKDPIDELREQFERIQGWIEALSLEIPTPDALKGNIVYLETIIFEMEKLPAEEQDEGFLADIDFELARLKALLPVVEIELVEPLDMDVVCGLVALEIFDDGLVEYIKEAGYEEIIYALALVTGDEERTDVLQKALELD